MLRSIFVILFSAVSLAATAQGRDSIFVKATDDGWMLKHRVKPQETLFSLARRYHVPPAILAGLNNLTYQNQLIENSAFYVPVAAYNIVNKRPDNMPDARPIYHRVQEDETLRRIARLSSVQQNDLERWNNLPDNNIYIDQVLLVGWVLYDATPMPAAEQVPQSQTYARPVTAPVTKPAPTPTPPARPAPKASVVVQQPSYTAPQNEVKKDTLSAIADTVKVHSPAEDAYMAQTVNEQNVMTEKGPAVFFDMPGSKPNMFFAFHNHVTRGNVIKVHNPGNGKTVFVKVIGPLPATKLYVGSTIGISSNARAALGIKGNKGWCELFMPPY